MKDAIHYSMKEAEMSFEQRCGEERERLRVVAGRVRYLLESPVFNKEEAREGQHAEMKSNIMISYRHIEDARMRIGKILQAAGDGVSILDKL